MRHPKHQPTLQLEVVFVGDPILTSGRDGELRVVRAYPPKSRAKQTTTQLGILKYSTASANRQRGSPTLSNEHGPFCSDSPESCGFLERRRHLRQDTRVSRHVVDRLLVLLQRPQDQRATNKRTNVVAPGRKSPERWCTIVGWLMRASKGRVIQQPLGCF